MKYLKVLWVEDDLNFPGSINYRVKRALLALLIDIENHEIISDGQYVWEMVRDWHPDIIMMDHNLEDIKVNGAMLITHIRFQNHDTPIIFYSSEMGAELREMVDGENEVYTSPRGDVSDELLRLIQNKFTTPNQ